MGCGSSSAQVGAVNEHVMDALKNGSVVSDPEPQQEHPDSASRPVNPHEVRPSEAFEIPLDESDNGLIKRHPPKRFQKLEMEAQDTEPPTIEELEEKLANAELRRKKVRPEMNRLTMQE